MNYHVIEAQIRYRTFAEGGRKSGVRSGYRGQFYYDGEDFDAIQFFPGVHATAFIELGREIRAFLQFCGDRWEQVHEHKLHEGKVFQIREGTRIVGEGIVTRLDVPAIEWRDLPP